MYPKPFIVLPKPYRKFVLSRFWGGEGPTGSGSVCLVKVKAKEGPCSSNVSNLLETKRENDSGDSVFSPPQVTPQAEPTH